MLSLQQIPIIDTWKRLGGGDLQGRPPRFRGRAFWRDADGFNISLDTDKDAFFDHRDAVGGGVLALTETALGCDRRAALEWLGRNCGLDDNRLSPAELAAAQRQRREEEAFEERLQPSYRQFLAELERRRNQLIFLLRRGDDSDLELELEILYGRIDNMRRAMGDWVDPAAVELTIAIVDMIAEATE